VQVVLIERDSTCTGWLADRLGSHGFIPVLDEAPSGVPSSEACEGSRAIVLDLGAEIAAAGLIDRIRRTGIKQPCLVLAAHDSWRDKIESLDAGADDYVVKPIRSEEIAARLRAVIRRSSGNSTGLIQIGGLKLDLRVRCAWIDGKSLNLTRNEFRLLRLFLLEPENVMTHQEIFRQLYPGRQEPSLNGVEVLIARLRRKIGSDRIKTIRGLGYRYFDDGSYSVEKEVCLRLGANENPDLTFSGKYVASS